MALGVVALVASILIFNTFFAGAIGMSLSLNVLNQQSLIALLAMLVCVFIICLLPAINAYRVSKV